MKTKFIFSALLLCLTYSIQAQNLSKNAIGLRLGNNDGFGGEFSYQALLNPKNRLEIDLGIRNSKDINALKLAGLYQWVWQIDGGFNWYAGVGGGLGSWKYDKNNNSSNGTFLFGAGDLGVEYNFDVPIQISLDMRPEFYFNSTGYRDNNFGPDIALAIRYKF